MVVWHRQLHFACGFVCFGFSLGHDFLRPISTIPLRRCVCSGKPYCTSHRGIATHQRRYWWRQAGRELITSLCLQVYQLASGTKAGQQQPRGRKSRIIDCRQLAPAAFVVGKDQTIVTVTLLPRGTWAKPQPTLRAKNIYSVLDLSFPAMTRSMPGSK